MAIARRTILKGGALSLLSLGLDPPFLRRLALAADGGKKTLVCLFQRGAVDGLSMLVPHEEASYYADRPGIAVAKGTEIDLDGRFGLHPKLAPLKRLFDAKELAVVTAVGSPSATRSHFDAQRYMEIGEPDGSGAEGWLNRCLACEGGVKSETEALAFGAMMPVALSGSEPALVIQDLRSFGLRTAPALREAFARLYQGTEPADLVGQAGREAFQAMARIEALVKGQDMELPTGYPRGEIGIRLSQVARVLKSDLSPRVVFVDCGGWDTHVGQNGRLPPLLEQLGGALAAFRDDLGGRLKDVLLLTMSEFGRTVAENGSGGTDHGHATTMFLLGGSVAGGKVYGRWPGLARESRFEGRDLAVSTDFRDLFAEVAAKQLGARDLSRVFPGYRLKPGNSLGLLS